MSEEDLRVPTVSLDGEVLFTDGRTLKGRLFLAAASASHPGPTTAIEHMNDADDFLAFLPEELEVPVILNKAEVLGLSFVAEPRSEEQEALFEQRKVVLDCGGHRIEGTLSIDNLEGQRRILDYLNRASRFLVVRDGERDVLVNRQRISRVIEVRDE